jgi:hypothetical protein
VKKRLDFLSVGYILRITNREEGLAMAKKIKKLIISGCDDCEREFYLLALHKVGNQLLCEDCLDQLQDWEDREDRQFRDSKGNGK